MDQQTLQDRLGDLSIPAVRYYPSVGSTNDLAAAWAAQGAPDLALVTADEQTRGRGRAGRRWHTPPGAALAFSLVLRPQLAPAQPLAHLTALGALAVCQALQDSYGLPAKIKWPNDVLVGGRKLCGVLVETSWQGNRIHHAVLGVGVNVTPAAVPPGERLNFPATDVCSAVGGPVERLDLLAAILQQLVSWYGQVGSPEFLAAWKLHLAFLNEMVQILRPDAPGQTGRITGLAEDGALLLQLETGAQFAVDYGDVQMRPVDS